MEPTQPLPRSARLVALIDKLGPALEVEDAQLLIEAAQTAHRLESGQGFTAKPVISMRDGAPFVDCTWMGMLAQVTPEQARSMGLGLIQTASEADSDAAMLKFLKETGISDEKAAAAISFVRELRQRFETVHGERQEPADSLKNIIPFGSKPS